MKVLFVDERAYRFSQYYKRDEWWTEHGIKPVWCDYEKKINKYKAMLFLLTKRPRYLVIVQLSTKNLVLSKLANLCGVKVVLWQHGFFAYPVVVKSVLKKRFFKPSIEHLMALSTYDSDGIGRVFRNIKHTTQICHYQRDVIAKEGKGFNGKTTVLYIGQILFEEQIKGSNGIVSFKKEDEELFEKVVDRLDEDEATKLIVKKHPGDKSNYLTGIVEKHKSVAISDDWILPDYVIGHCSTLLVAYAQLRVPIIQLPYLGEPIIDLGIYDAHFYFVKSLQQFDAALENIISTKSRSIQPSNESFDISEALVSTVLTKE